ncbi:MAG: hypothetical protein AAF594_16210, partial [Bacteroidota bacterium]
MPDLTRTEAERLLDGLRSRRADAIERGDYAELEVLDDKIADVEVAIANPVAADGSPAPTVRATRQGSGGNVLAALASFLFPGLGQLLQGRLGDAFFHFLIAC